MVDFLFDCLDLVFLFIYIGIDVFGLWIIVICKICGGEVNLKCWVLLFICFVVCVVYIELLEEMLFFSFINVFR